MHKNKENNVKYDPDAEKRYFFGDESIELNEVERNLFTLKNDTYMVETQFCRGVQFDRSKNWANLDYSLDISKEGDGMKSYVHKYFLGMEPFYFELHSEKTFNRMEELKKKS